MVTDHQINEGHPSRFEQRSGMAITAAIIVILVGTALWTMT
jgi:hypothetical protein